MRAIGKYVLLLPVRGKDTTESGLHLPESMRSSKNTCKVISKGDEVSDRINVDDVVVFSTGNSFEREGESYFICEEKNILLVL